MRDFSRRIKKAEERLNLNKKHITVNVIQYGGELPPDQIEGNITTHYVMYDKEQNDDQQSQKKD